MNRLGSNPGTEELGNRKSGCGSAGLDTQSALAFHVCRCLLGSAGVRTEEPSDNESLERYAGSSPASSEMVQPARIATQAIQGDELLPQTRPWAYMIAELAPDLWSKFTAACERDAKERVSPAASVSD